MHHTGLISMPEHGPASLVLDNSPIDGTLDCDGDRTTKHFSMPLYMPIRSNGTSARSQLAAVRDMLPQ